ncbi:hypothetical protein BZZ01_05835 [Nostocales cyanobacterium HT-58-2]|nr:hypothetical protein BZZ01_05835 [Nostocales cyanobacterium HT-58-2]
MSILKRLPFVSLALLLLTYMTFGWVTSQAHTPWSVRLLTVIAIVFLIGGLTTSWRRLADYSFVLFKSKFRSFSISLLAAFLFFLMLAWFRVFLDILLIVAATILARIDFQAAGFSERQAFWVLSVFSVTGFALAVLIQQFF